MPELITTLSSYKTLNTLADASSALDTDLAAASGYTIGAISGEIDLLTEYGSGTQTKANSIQVIVKAKTAADGDTLTHKIYGRNDQGPPQLLSSIIWTIGTARFTAATATDLWADTASVTSTHFVSIGTADAAGGNRVASISFDVTGYRYLLGLFTDQTGDPTETTALYKVY